VYGADKQPDSKIPTKKMTRRRQAYEANDWLEWNEKHDGLLWQESKESRGLAVRCFFYASGRRVAYSCHGGKGAMRITFEDYQARSFHTQPGGTWTRRIYDENERVKEVVDLHRMLTVKLEPPAPKPLQVPIRDNAPIRRYSDEAPPPLTGIEFLRPYSVRNHAVYPPFTENIWHVVNSSKNNQCMATFDTEEKALHHARHLNYLHLPNPISAEEIKQRVADEKLGNRIIIVIFFALIALSGVVRMVSTTNHPSKSNFVRQLTPPVDDQIDNFKERFSVTTKSQSTE
jgi:hypothetical protein